MVKPKPNAPNVTKPPPNKISRVGGIRRAFWLSMLRSPLTTLQNTDGVNHVFWSSRPTKVGFSHNFSSRSSRVISCLFSPEFKNA